MLAGLNESLVSSLVCRFKFALCLYNKTTLKSNQYITEHTAFTRLKPCPSENVKEILFLNMLRNIVNIRKLALT